MSISLLASNIWGLLSMSPGKESWLGRDFSVLSELMTYSNPIFCFPGGTLSDCTYAAKSNFFFLVLLYKISDEEPKRIFSHQHLLSPRVESEVGQWLLWVAQLESKGGLIPLKVNFDQWVAFNPFEHFFPVFYDNLFSWFSSHLVNILPFMSFTCSVSLTTLKMLTLYRILFSPLIS